jgi:hypothetical protein
LATPTLAHPVRRNPKGDGNVFWLIERPLVETANSKTTWRKASGFFICGVHFSRCFRFCPKQELFACIANVNIQQK